MSSKRRTKITRREAVQTLLLGLGAIGVGRAAFACNETVGLPPRETTNPRPNNNTNEPTDDDEYVPGDSPPVDTGDEAPKVPNQAWEARVKQLESQQAVQFRPEVFTLADPGAMAGKERSHVPNATVIEENGKKRVRVVVQHVMGANGLDAGAYDAGPVDGGKGDGGADGGAIDDASLDGGPTDAGDAGDKDAGPMLAHYITTIYLRGVVNGEETVVGLFEFSSDDAAPPTVKFTVPEGVTGVTAYEWCTLHGLWASAFLAL